MKKEINQKTDQKDLRGFFSRVIFSTCVTFTLLVLGFLILFSLITEEGGAKFEYAVFTRYTLLKFVFLLLFSVSVGFLNRLFEWNKPRPIVRLIHFGGTLLSFLFFILFLMNQMNPVDSDTVSDAVRKTPLTPRYVVFSLVLFIVLYFVSVGTRALLRRLFGGKEKEYKSIFQ